MPVDTWTTKAAMPATKSQHQAAESGGLVYVFGGYNGSALSTAHAYDPGADLWTAKANLPTARRQSFGGSSGSLIYVQGGRNSAGTSQDNNWAYNPGSDTYDTSLTVIPVATGLSAAAEDGGIIFVFGGFTTTVVATTRAYDTGSGTWSTKADDLVARNLQGCFVLSGWAHVVAGNDSSGNTNSHSRYDMSGDTWESRQIYIANMVGPTGAAVDGVGYIIGGYRSATGTTFDANNQYDPATNLWTGKTSKPTASVYMSYTSAVVAGAVIVAGGQSKISSPTYFDINEVYQAAVAPGGRPRRWVCII